MKWGGGCNSRFTSRRLSYSPTFFCVVQKPNSGQIYWTELNYLLKFSNCTMQPIPNINPRKQLQNSQKESRGWTKVRFFVSTGFQLSWPQSIFPFAAIWQNFSEFCADKDRNRNANRRGGWRGGWPCGGGRWILQLPMVNSCSKQEHSAKTFTQTFLYHSCWNGFSLLD